MKEKKRVSRLQTIPGIGVDRMGDQADEAHDRNLLRMENLDTDISPSSLAIEATRQAIELDQNNSYLPFQGHDAMRRAAASHVSKISGVAYDWKKECVITAGGLSGVLNTLLAILEPGDEVIVTDPIYAGLINRIRLAGGVPRFIPLIPSANGWRLDLQALEHAATNRTAAVLMMSPSMPTGHVLTLEEWKAVADCCKKADAWLVYDAAMERILFDKRQVIHPASLPGMVDCTITIGSASKELRMIGWRVGWVVGPSAIMRDISLVNLSNVVCQVGIGMPGVAAALNASDADVKEAVGIWEKRRDLLMKELRDLPVIPPHGGWSFLLDAESTGFSSEQASKRLFESAKIAATPMNGWGEKASRYLRFVFSNEPEERLSGIGKKIRTALNL